MVAAAGEPVKRRGPPASCRRPAAVYSPGLGDEATLPYFRLVDFFLAVVFFLAGFFAAFFFVMVLAISTPPSVKETETRFTVTGHHARARLNARSMRNASAAVTPL